MFSGIVGAVGRVKAVKREPGAGNRPPGCTLTIVAPYRGLKRGESIAVNGACLTVERVVKGGFTVHAIATTLDRTLIGEYAVGRPVNLERALKASDRMGGHIVQGHVDGVARVIAAADRDDARLLDLEVPGEVREVTVPHGSITVDGVSLTVNALPPSGAVQVSLIPFTRTHTTLGSAQAGDRVHVEADVLGKYVKALCRTNS
jgi:riboflavin synthase